MGRPSGTKNIMKAPEEKEKIIIECINGTNSVKGTSIDYGISRRLLMRWINKYREFGLEGLKSNSGKSKSRINRNESIEIVSFKKRLSSERSWSSKGICYYIRCEYEIIDILKQSYSITYLCKIMSVSKK